MDKSHLCGPQKFLSFEVPPNNEEKAGYANSTPFAVNKHLNATADLARLIFSKLNLPVQGLTFLYLSLCWNDAEIVKHKEPMIDT